MQRFIKAKQVILVGLAAALIFAPFSSVIPVGAQASNANAADGLQISPAVIEVNGEKGKSYRIDIQVTNVTGTDLAFDSTVNNFSAKDETGAPSISINSINNDLHVVSSIKDWVAVIPSFTLKARQSQKIVTTLTIPQDAEPGGHYGVIRFSGRGPNLLKTGVGLAASAGSLVLVKVAGTIDEKLDLITFTSAQDGQESGFFRYGPIDFVMRFENKGNIHLKPVGQIEVRNIFGNKIETLSVNADKGNVLPNSIRKFQSSLDKQWLFGRYTADLSVAYGTTGQAIVKTISFWVIPWRLILIVLAAIITLIFVFRTLIKRYNSYIIKRAGRTNGKKTNNRKK